MALDLRRVLAEQIVGDDVVEVGLDGVGKEERLAEAGQPLVGVEQDVDEIGELVGSDCVDACDPHAHPS